MYKLKNNTWGIFICTVKYIVSFLVENIGNGYKMWGLDILIYYSRYLYNVLIIGHMYHIATPIKCQI